MGAILLARDEVTRHSVQRLFPETLVDMAAGGLQCQVIVKHKNNDALCLLNALSIPPDENDWAESLAAATGLRLDANDVSYFRHNQENGIHTFQDEEIEEHLARPRT